MKDYHFDIQCHLSKANLVADALRRQPTGEIIEVLNVRCSELHHDDDIARVCMSVLSITLEIMIRVVKTTGRGSVLSGHSTIAISRGCRVLLDQLRERLKF